MSCVSVLMKTVYIFIGIRSNNSDNIIVSIPENHYFGSLYFLKHDQELESKQKRLLMFTVAVKKLMK